MGFDDENIRKIFPIFIGLLVAAFIVIIIIVWIPKDKKIEFLNFGEYTENLFNDSHFDLDIEVEQHNINQIELSKYFSYFYEHYGLNTIFKEGLPKLDLKNQTLEMLFPSENLIDDASNSLKDLQNLFAKIGLKEFQVKLQLHIPESAPMIEEVPVI